MTTGIHHVTAICGDAQKNVDFYAGILGLRLVKRTVNFDDPQTYHLYYGDERGSPGSLMTFFPWPGAERGRVGPGQVAVTALAIPANALGFWIERLLRQGIRYQGPTPRRIGADATAEQVLAFEDGDGLKLELVATPAADARMGWDGAPGIPAAAAVRGVHGVMLWEEEEASTAQTLVELLGLTRVGEEGTTRRFVARDRASGNDASGNEASGDVHSVCDIRVTGAFPRGSVAVGTVHHVAWRVRDEAEQLSVRERLLTAGLEPTPVIDRQYFQSVYFREPGGVLFELATDGPGFAVDEAPEQLGERLVLPSQYEPYRAGITSVLPELHVPGDAWAHYRNAEE